LWIECLIARDGDTLSAFPVAYRLNRDNFTTEFIASWPLSEVYSTRDAAQKAAVWHSVVGISDEEWPQALGDREDDASLDTCDLYRCCANIAHVREVLYTCRKDSGLKERDLAALKVNYLGCRGPLTQEELKTPLGRILIQLGIPTQETARD
jgi:hypothetical protein